MRSETEGEGVCYSVPLITTWISVHRKISHVVVVSHPLPFLFLFLAAVHFVSFFCSHPSKNSPCTGWASLLSWYSSMNLLKPKLLLWFETRVFHICWTLMLRKHLSRDLKIKSLLMAQISNVPAWRVCGGPRLFHICDIQLVARGQSAGRTHSRQWV